MKTPWINHEEMKRISITRQTVFFFTVAREQYKSQSDDSKIELSTETDSGHYELDIPLSTVNTDEIINPNDNSEENQALDLHKKNDECKKTGVCQVVKKIKEIQTDLVYDKRSLPFDYFTEGNYFNKMIDYVNLKQVHQTDVTHETDNNLQIKSRFNFEYISEFDLAPSYIESVKSVNVLGKLASTRILEPSKKRDKSIKFGISQLINVLKKIQTIYTNDSLELSIAHQLPTIDGAGEVDYVIDSQSECEPVHISIADAPLGYIELDKSDSSLKNPNNLGVIELDEENSKSKKMGMYRLVNTLKRVRKIHTEVPLELLTDNNCPVIDEASEIDHVNNLQTECEPVHISPADVPPDNIELDKPNSLLEETDNPGGIELDVENSESKQLGIYRLVNTLKKLQTIPTNDPFELSIEHNSPVIDEVTEVSHDGIELQTECEFEAMLTSESGYIDNVNEEIVKEDTNKIEATEEMDEISQSGNIYCKTIKSPFATFVEIEDFLHAPLFGEISQHTFEFLDPSNKQSFQLDTKFISTSTYYPEQPSCHLVSSAIHEIIYLTKDLHTNGTKKHNHNNSKSIMIPIHSSQKIGESNHANDTHDFIKIRVPVIVGEYKIEICIEEEILFEEEVTRINKVSKNVVLTNCHFTPTQLSKPLGDGTCAASNGVLSIEGLIVQNIEYVAMFDTNKSSFERTEVIHLHEKITLELMVQLLQEQGIRVHYNDLKNYKND